jgi:hypothetical protein
MSFFRRIALTIQKSFYNPEFYHENRAARVGKPLAALTTITAMWALALSVMAFVAIQAFVQSDIIDRVADLYPDDLVVTIEDGEASANVEQPYYIPMPPPLASSSTPQYLAIIDTRPEVTIDELFDETSVIYLTKRTLVFINKYEVSAGNTSRPRVSHQYVNVADIPNQTIDRSKAERIADMARPIVNGIAWAAPFVIFIALLAASVVGYLFIAVFGALIVWLLARMKGLRFSYRTSYVTALFALIPVAIWDLFTDIAGVGNYFLITLAIYILVILVNVRPIVHDSALSPEN